VVGVVPKHRALMAQSHGRDAGGTPARGDQVRRRLETAEEAEAEDSDSDSDEAMTAKRDVDAEWRRSGSGSRTSRAPSTF
jgi:hypothetical protein